MGAGRESVSLIVEQLQEPEAPLVQQLARLSQELIPGRGAQPLPLRVRDND